VKLGLQEQTQLHAQKSKNYTICQYLPEETEHTATLVAGMCIHAGIAAPVLPEMYENEQGYAHGRQ
jgi:hypothetical protein